MGIRGTSGTNDPERPEGRHAIDVGHAGVRKIIDTTCDGVWVFDTKGRTTYVSRRMAEMLGATPDELIGAKLQEFLDPEDRAAAERDLHGWLTKQAGANYQHLLRRDGKDLWTRIASNPIENEYHSIVGLLGMFTDITERRSMEQALQRAETEFRIVFDASAVGIVVVDRQGYAVMANAALLNMLGYRREEITEVSFEHITHPDDLGEDRRLYTALMRGEIDSFRREKRYVTRSGKVLWVHVNASLVRSTDGIPQYAISMIEDVTERVKAERAFHHSETQLRLALDAARMVIWSWDVPTHRLEWSDNLHRVFDLPFERTPTTLEEVIETVAPEDRERVRSEMNAAVANADFEFVSEYRVIMDNGETRWFEARGEVERDSAGKALCMRGTAVDVTARKSAEVALRASEERFRTLADAAFEGIAISDEGKLVDLNNRMLSLLDVQREDVIGRNIAPWFANESTAEVQRRIREGDTGMYEATLLRRDGRPIQVEIQARYFQADQGRTLRVAAVRDVSARRLAAELLQQSQERELRAREDFSRHLLNAQEQERQRLAGELHDGLGQNLSLIRNRMHLALETANLDPEVAEHLQAVAQIASDCVAEVRSLAQNLRPVQIEQLGLTESLSSLVERVRDSSTTEIECRIEDVDDTLPPDAATHLYRICQEALNNVLRHANAQHASLTLVRDVGILHLDVRDDGVGFDVRTASGASGLGLTSIRERAQILGGNLEVHSLPGKGTYLHVRIPFTEPAERH